MVLGGVFINYRGEDSYSYGALLHVELSRRFGPESVFLDSASIPAGADYVERLLDRVRQARVVLAVIGPRWLAAAGDGGRRLVDDPADWVRRELAEAFAAGVRVIPVLTDQAQMPTETQLPEELRALARCQFRQLRHRDATADLARLVADLTEADPDLAAALHRGPYPEEVDCPYPGMVAFDPAQARFFRGRDRLVAGLLSRLALQVRRGGGPLVVIGPSGVGKSSLLRAGLLPALAAGDLPIEGSACWPQLYLRPGTDPLAELAAQVNALGVVEEYLPATMRADPDALRHALRHAVDQAPEDPAAMDAAGAVDSAAGIQAAASTAAAVVPGVDAGAAGSVAGSAAGVGVTAPASGGHHGRVVVVVDQVEELFTHGSVEADRLATLRALIRASQTSTADPAPAVVVLGLRAGACHDNRVSPRWTKIDCLDMTVRRDTW